MDSVRYRGHAASTRWMLRKRPRYRAVVTPSPSTTGDPESQAPLGWLRLGALAIHNGDMHRAALHSRPTRGPCLDQSGLALTGSPGRSAREARLESISVRRALDIWFRE